MPKIFMPINSIIIPASKPHPDNTEYKISIGYEAWGGINPVHVIKIQMVYNGNVSGRRSPSYPVGTDDYERVIKATEDLLKRNNI